MLSRYDVIVVGGGHAGCEAAAASANLGMQVLLITMDMSRIAQMSCNPAMGGIAKGQIIREVDAMGGYSGIVSDRSTIQFRMLNRSKGPAMWSPRSQNDRMLFSAEWRRILENLENVDFWQDTVESIKIEGNKARGVTTTLGLEVKSRAVILTSGTFLNGVIHIGDKQFGGGRVGERASKGITEQLVSLGFQNGRMKTGTPPRIDGRSINYSKMEVQEGDENPGKFSFVQNGTAAEQKACHIAYTNKNVHDILRTGFDRSPMFNGRIKASGPRYCPSIEDKINRFSDKDRHQLFVEPEGLDTVEVYLNGFSTSLPEDIQIKALKQVSGLEKVKMFRPGYAIEYDYFPPMQLRQTLETKQLGNLYFAGQINGTTGYEEAACQGLMAGINAARKLMEADEVVLKRSEAYIGVLIDDLITKGTDEPYRMFTSRAEYRILLRQDNADIRLTPKSYVIGLVGVERMKAVDLKRSATHNVISFFKSTNITPEEINPFLIENGASPIRQKLRLFSLLSRPEVKLSDLRNSSASLDEFLEQRTDIPADAIEQAEIVMKYQGYIEKEEVTVQKIQRLEETKLSASLDYSKLVSLSSEAREKLDSVRPATVGQASRISGVSPSDISVLLVYMGR